MISQDVIVLLRLPTANLLADNCQHISLNTLTVSHGLFLPYISNTKNILAIAAAIKAAPNVAVALVIEPDSLPNLVTNANLTTCQASASDYKAGVAYALQQLNLPNVAMYIDAGHGGWLGWDANLSEL
jgi:cellulase/cellobiase CelA1